MKKLFAIFPVLIISFNLFSQSQSYTFKIGNYLEVLDNDSVLIYFNCTGTVVEKRCAEYFRIGKIDSININVSGQFRDYYMNGERALEAIMENDYLNGEATYYYENGNLKSKGKYKQDKKVGIWTSYYDNGVKKSIINYVNDYPFISEYYNKKGKQKVVGGNGKFKGEFNSYKNCTPFTIWGEVENGKMAGKWTLYNSYFHQKIGNEFFEDGKFVKGVSGDYTYTDYPKIYINGFCANENLHLEDNSLGCPGDKGIFFLEYKSNSLHSSFYPELLDTLSSALNQNIHNQWLIVGLKVNKESEINCVNIKSSINDNFTELVVQGILNSKKDFTAAKINGEYIDSELFFTILIRNSQVIIPTDYIFSNR